MVTKRLDLKVGFACNNNCRFCVIADRKNLGDRSTDDLKKAMVNGFEVGANQIVLTGGEPLIRKDIFELVSFAKQVGFEQIQLQTNGRMFSYLDFTKKIIKSGMTEASPALHGHLQGIHDYLTNTPKSYLQTVNGIKNLKKEGIQTLTNSVITKSNYEFLPELASLLISLEVDQFQFAFVHAIGNAASNFDSIVPLKSLVKPFVHKAMDLAKEAKVNSMIEAYPFCFMEGYESYCSENYIPPTEIRDFDKVITDFTKSRIEQGKLKFEGCKKCSYDSVCEGPWREYPEKRGWSEFIPRN